MVTRREARRAPSRDAALARHRGDDFPAVETAIFDENIAGIQAADDDARDVNSGNVRLESFGIDIRLASHGIERNSLPFEKLEIRVVSGHREDLRRRDGSFLVH